MIEALDRENFTSDHLQHHQTEELTEALRERILIAREAGWVKSRDLADVVLRFLTIDRKGHFDAECEAAELERKVVDAAVSLVADWDQTKTVLTRLPAMDLRDSVCKLEKALAPPSLEDEIKGVVNEWLRDGKSSTDYLIPNILVVVEKHKG